MLLELLTFFVEHCTCVVDLLVGASILADAKAFIRDLVFHDEPVGQCGYRRGRAARQVMNNTNKMCLIIR